MNRWQSPVGAFDVRMGPLGVSRVEETNGKKWPELDPVLAKSFNEHIQGQPTSMRLDLLGLAPFRQVTLAKLLEIPYGEVRSYSWVAREIGRPSAIRAVASAVAKNPLPLLIPCHRVVRSDGTIGEYSLRGKELKREILTFEGVDIARLDALTARGTRYIGDSEAKCFHVRTCRLVPSPAEKNYVELKSADAAEKQLLKPCRRCRPVHVF